MSPVLRRSDLVISLATNTMTGKVKTGNLDALIHRYPAPQLATLVDAPPVGPQWLHEVTFDGYRLLGYVAGGMSYLRTRNGNDWTFRFPAIAADLKKLKVREAVVDLEAVVLNDEGKSSFQALQAALGNAGNSRSIVAYAFDLLHLDGQDLTKLPLTERKEKLRKLLENSPGAAAFRYSDHVIGQ